MVLLVTPAWLTAFAVQPAPAFAEPWRPGICAMPPPGATAAPDGAEPVLAPPVVFPPRFGPADEVICSPPVVDSPGFASFEETSAPVFARIATAATTPTRTSAMPAALSRLSATQATGRCSMAATFSQRKQPFNSRMAG